MDEEFKLRPAGDKSRFGYRGQKKRYAVFKAEWNQKWEPYEQSRCLELCEEHGLDPEQFMRPQDNQNRKWCFALLRVEKSLGMYPYKFN